MRRQIFARSTKYVEPQISAVDELDSLTVHSHFFQHSYNSSKPSDDELDAIFYMASNIFQPIHMECPNWYSYENYFKVVRSLDFTSTPGYPFTSEASTIGDWFGFNGFSFDPLRLSFMWQLVSRMLDDLLAGIDFQEDLFWRVFIKQEPHKKSKSESRRWRLIMAPPLNLQIVWQMIFAQQNAKEVEMAYELPCQQGMVIPYGGWKKFYDFWKTRDLTWGSDKSAWDWTCPWWALKLDLELRGALITADNNWQIVASALYKNAFIDCKLMLSNGAVYQQQFPGVMKSGCVNTISTNSHCQVFLHILYSIRKGISVEPLLVCVGDDTLQSRVHAEDVQVYESFGVIIKTVTEGMEFLGRQWSDTGPRPMYTGKHVSNLLVTKDENLPQVFQSYLMEYCVSDDEYIFFSEIAYILGCKSNIKTRRFYQTWLNNPLFRVLLGRRF